MQKVLKILDDNNLLDDFNFRFTVSKQDELISVLTQPVLKKSKEPKKKELPIFVAAGTAEELENTLHEKILEALSVSQTSIYKISEFAKQMEQAAGDKEAEAKKELKKKPGAKTSTKPDNTKKEPDGKGGLFSKADLEKKPDLKKEKEKTEPESDGPAKEKTAAQILKEKRAEGKTKINEPNKDNINLNPETIIPPAGETKTDTTDSDQSTEEIKDTPPEGQQDYGEDW